jgi:hypothetical protein
MLAGPVKDVTTEAKHCRKARGHHCDYQGSSIWLGDNDEPHQYDVICGRGRRTAPCHHGNQFFLDIVARNATRYRHASDQSLVVAEIGK